MMDTTGFDLRIANLSVGYGKKPVIRDLSLAPLEAGQVTALVEEVSFRVIDEIERVERIRSRPTQTCGIESNDLVPKAPPPVLSSQPIQLPLRIGHDARMPV